MFSNEIIVKGNYVSGTIKKNDGNKDSSHHPYILHSGLNFGGRGGTTWTADKLREIIVELDNVITEMDKQNGIVNAPTFNPFHLKSEEYQRETVEAMRDEEGGGHINDSRGI